MHCYSIVEPVMMTAWRNLTEFPIKSHPCHSPAFMAISHVLQSLILGNRYLFRADGDKTKEAVKLKLTAWDNDSLPMTLYHACEGSTMASALSKYTG